jgi:hypothetical protein
VSKILSIAALALSLSIAGTPAFASTFEGNINARLSTNGLYDVAVMASTEKASSVLIGRHLTDPNTGKISGGRVDLDTIGGTTRLGTYTGEISNPDSTGVQTFVLCLKFYNGENKKAVGTATTQTAADDFHWVKESTNFTLTAVETC